MNVEKIQIWIDTTEPSRPYIVSRGYDGDAPATLGVWPTYAHALAHAKRVAEDTGLEIVDEVTK